MAAQRNGVVVSWTRVERPAAGFEPGRVVVLVDADEGRTLALWDAEEEPTLDQFVILEDLEPPRAHPRRTR